MVGWTFPLQQIWYTILVSHITFASNIGDWLNISVYGGEKKTEISDIACRNLEEQISLSEWLKMYERNIRLKDGNITKVGPSHRKTAPLETLFLDLYGEVKIQWYGRYYMVCLFNQSISFGTEGEDPAATCHLDRTKAVKHTHDLLALKKVSRPSISASRRWVPRPTIDSDMLPIGKNKWSNIVMAQRGHVGQ